jgi:glucose/arabinose dehydrogenase
MLNTSRALLLLGLLGSSLAHAMDYRIETVVSGLEHPWSLAFLPDGSAACASSSRTAASIRSRSAGCPRVLSPLRPG